MTRYIQRHSLMKRAVHGIHTVSCFALILTGLVLFVPGFAESFGATGVEISRLGHRVFGVAFILVPLGALVLAPKGFVHILQNLFANWDADDRKFMALFPKYLFAPKTTHMPKQRAVKSGQRLSDGFLILVCIAIAVSGVVLWAGAYVPPVYLRIALAVHDVAFAAIAVIMVIHVYLGAGVWQPYRGLGRLMFGSGRVSEAEARYHWGHWAEDELKKGANVIDDGIKRESAA